MGVGTLRVELRERYGGPGIQVSILMPPVGKPVPSVITVGGERYGFKEVMPSGTLLYLLNLGCEHENTLPIDISKTPVRRTEGLSRRRVT